MSDAVTPDSVKRKNAIMTHTDALRRALIQGTLGLVALLVVAAVVWMLIDGTAGLWGAVIGAAVAGFFVLTTAITALKTAHSTPTLTGAVMMGTWLLKIIVVIAVVAVLRGYDFYSRGAFLSTLVIAMVVVLFMETRALVKAKVPFVEPEASA